MYILYIQKSVKLQPMPYRGQKPQDIGCEQVITWKHVQYMYYVHVYIRSLTMYMRYVHNEVYTCKRLVCMLFPLFPCTCQQFKKVCTCEHAHVHASTMFSCSTHKTCTCRHRAYAHRIHSYILYGKCINVLVFLYILI